MSQDSRSTFGKYTLLRKLASGGMGEVFLAKQRGPSGFEKLLVIKRILSHHLDKRDYLDMFFSEAKLVARLNHNNIIQIHEMGEIDGDYYIAMEYVRGKSLRDIIDELRAEGRVLPLPHVVDLAIKLCEGLGYAHQARDIRGRPMGIVHRDINPHNVLISYNGDLKLIDFGIAKSEMTSVHTATGTIKGKFVYMSPEQSAADPIDRRSDIFSLGIVLYEMTVLENPFVRQNVVLSLEAIQRHAIPPPSAKRPDAGPMDAILLRALEKKPEERYQTATEMRDDLRNLFRNGQVTPSEEDVSIFLHDLFSADIDEEDRLLAEADRATSPPLAIQEVDTRAAFELPPQPPKSIDLEALHKAAGLGGTPHSSDISGANPLKKNAFADEEPTLSGNLQALKEMSREVSSRNILPAVAAPPGQEDNRPQGQVMTLIPPDEVVPGTDEEFLPEIPTRSDRLPKRPRSNPDIAPLGLGGGSLGGSFSPQGPVPGAPMGGPRTPPPRPAPFNEPLNGESKNDTTLRMRHPDHRDDEPAPIEEEEDDDPVLAQIARSHSGESRPGASVTIVPPFRSTMGTEDRGGGPPGPRWKSLGLAIAGVLVFAATAVAGFLATRAVTRPAGALRDKPQPMEVLRKGDNPGSVEKTQIPQSPDEAKSATVSVKTRAGDLPEKSPDPKPMDAASEDKLEKPERKLSPKEERRRKLEEERAKAAAAKEEKKRKLEEEKKKKEDERKRQLEDRREAERRRHEEEAAARKAVADAKKAEAAKREASEDRGSAQSRKQPKAGEVAPDEKGEAPKRRVVVPVTNDEKSEPAGGQAADASKRKVVVPEEKAASDETPKRKVVVPEEKAASDETPKRKVVAPQETAATEPKDDASQKKRVSPSEAKAGDAAPSRVGTLTLSTSVEVNIEIDGRPAGTTPWVVSVKKGSGKIKLFGPNIEYSVTLSYKVEDEGVSMKIETDPWVIAKYNGISLGKTPQSVKGAAKHRFSLIRPGQHAPLVVSLLWNPKSE